MKSTINRSVPDNWMRFGKWIAEKRESRRLSLQDAANRAHMHKQTWYAIEHGRSTKRDTVIKMARTVGANVDEALTEAGFQPLYNEPLTGAEVLLSFYNKLSAQQASILLKVAMSMADEYAQTERLTQTTA